MDEEILKLQQELMAVQKTESRKALSERNVVELLIKLRELGLVRFIHSVNGREMITPEQLIREIEMVIWQKRMHFRPIRPSSHCLEHIEGRRRRKEFIVDMHFTS
jgi:hypothetical protein